MRRFSFLILALALTSGTAFAKATVTIKNVDTGTAGLNDTTAVDPVGGNPGRTLGEQRLNVFKKAAEIWGNAIDSNVEIVVEASFSDLDCSDTTGVATLGSAGPVTFFVNFSGAPKQNVWYPIALANKFSGTDLNQGTAEIRARFSSKLGKPGCTSFAPFYLGLDGNHGDQQDFLSTALHEIGHGLGFTGTVNVSTGAQGKASGSQSSFPSIFEQNIFDATTGLHWDQMTDAQRVTSATNDQGLLWDGPEARKGAATILQGTPILRVNSPSSVAKQYEVGTATFGGRINLAGTTASVVAATDSNDDGSTLNACSAILNPAAIVGRIALVDRGACNFTVKAKNVQTAGAIGMIVVDNDATVAQGTGMGGLDPTLTIPAVRLTKADGDRLRAAIASGLNATITVDPSRPAGVDAAGRVKLYAPGTLRVGSSVFHWDVSAYPNVLMEPNINDDLHAGDIDITLDEMVDVGWVRAQTSIPVQPSPDPIPSGRRSIKRGK